LTLGQAEVVVVPDGALGAGELGDVGVSFEERVQVEPVSMNAEIEMDV
jgi:hypothetical protein